MSNTAIEILHPAQAVTCRAAAPLTAGQFVRLVAGTGNHPTVTLAEAGERVFGIAGVDANTGDLLVVQRGPGRCFEVATEAPIEAADELEAGTDGAPVQATDGTIAAVALRASAAGRVEITLV